MSSSEELKAALAARRDLGPDFEEAIAASFLDKVGQEVDRRVDERLRAAPARRRPGPTDGQRLALAIVSLALGTGATIALAALGALNPALLVIWLGIVAVNFVFNRPGA
ncbi:MULTISPECIES: hypothetical protein [Nonomuraea]|uniref:DUF3040 domain-containing protein n=2 Tax=Nonomuraea TaxID=83681 RepID=A0ABW1BN24_9ACTN|nr:MULTISPECIES: hypothetical protein [Nonomuraea]MDA0642182.1 hypothetical protein [Nonomuraea ferruginea]TXK39592.1 hypothetical protein FR742_08285 [Nonomuraea sp. C10]